MNRIGNAFALLTGLLLLASCSSLNDKHQKVLNNITAANNDFAQYQQQKTRLHYVDVVDGFYVPALSKVAAFRPQWWFTRIDQFNLSNMPLTAAMVILENEYAVPSRFASDIPEALNVDLIHSGTIGELITRIARQSQLHFEFAQGVLVWQKYQSKMFDISFIPSDKAMAKPQNMALADNSNSSNNYNERSNYSSGNSQSYIANELQNNAKNNQAPAKNLNRQLNDRPQSGGQADVWQDIDHSLQYLISPNGKYTLSQSNSTLMAYDHPENISRIGQYIEALNHKLTQQIAIEVQIIEVKMNDEFEYGINWNIVKNVMTNSALAGFTSPLQSGLFNDSNASALLFDVTAATSRYAGSSALIQALEQQGQVSITTSPRTVTLNNQQAQITVSEQTSYLASSSTNQSANVGSQTTLRPGVATTGLSLKVLPLAAQGNIILNVEGQLSSLTGITVVESNGSVIQTPSVASKHILQKVKVPINQTLMLAGFKTTENASTDAGLFGQAWLNGSVKTKATVSEVIILLKPTVIY